MATSIVDKYEQILAADPRSRIFVELARALVDRGEHARAVEVCRRGLEHHPGAILGRVTWGRALLEAGDTKGAMDQFEIAIGLEPASPYAYNHVGEALRAKGLYREALPVLARAAELQPADARVRGWLEDAKARAKGEKPASTVSAASAQPSPPTPTPTSTSSPTATATSTATPTPTPTTPTATATSTSPAVVPAAIPAAVPPPLPPGAASQRNGARSVLHMIPAESARDTVGPSLASRLAIPAVVDPPAAPVHVDPAEAERVAEEYERTLREKLLAAPPPPPSFLHRHRRLVLGAAVAVAVGAAAGVYLVVSARNAARDAATAATRGRAGLGRDTLASLREAHRLLSAARGRSKDPEVASLAAQVAAILAVEHGDEKAGEVARALVASGSAGDGAAAASWLLARTAAERAAAEKAVLAARPSSGPLLQALAGRVLVGRGEIEGGRGRLEIAARAVPPLLRALSDLGDVMLAGGDAEAALAYYGAALEAHATHPRSAVGAAEARLALGRDLELSRRQLEAVDADAGSVPPLDLRARFEIARARVHAALGEPGPAAVRLARAAERLGETAVLAAAVAELHLQARAWDKAEAAASRAVAREPRSAEHRVLLARARIGRGRHAAALAATEGAEGRAVRIQRAIARYRLGQWREARAELEKTARDGKVPGEAAVWYAFVDVAAGNADRALPLVQKLAEARPAPPLAHVALGRALEALGRRAEAEAAYRAAVEREPLAPEPHAALGTLLLAAGRPRDAVAPLERAVRIDPSDLSVRRALGEARLAAGQPSAARADLDFVLLAAPRDAGALQLVSAAWLAEGEAREARLAADRAVGLAPRDPSALLSAARAALAAGDAPAARKLAERALKSGAKDAQRDEAKRIASGMLPRRR
jgi:tetratricopeptide (TPR) repeat protein